MSLSNFDKKNGYKMQTNKHIKKDQYKQSNECAVTEGVNSECTASQPCSTLCVCVLLLPF
jgi:hypothetical protein